MKYSKYGDRFIRPRDFCRYAKELRIVPTTFCERMLLFLWKQKLLAPIVCIRFPKPIVTSLYIRFRRGKKGLDLFETESDENLVEVIDRFVNDVHYWGQPSGAPQWHHVLDNVPTAFAEYVELKPVASRDALESNKRIQIGTYNGQPLYTADYQYDFYRYWQVLQLAEILAMKIEVFTNLLEPDVQTLVKEWKLDELRDDMQLRTLPFNQVRIISEFNEYQREWETIAYSYAYSRMASDCRWLARQTNRGDPALVDDRYGDQSARIAAAEAIHRYESKVDRLKEFLGWLCERWDHWTDLGQEMIASEYRWNVSAAVETICAATDISFDSLADEIGRITGHYKDTLRVVLPDWIEERREELIRYLEHRLTVINARYSQAYIDADSDNVKDFVRWIEEESVFQIYYHYETLADLNVRSDSLARIGYAKEAVALTTTLEHVVNALLKGVLTVRGKTLLPKLCDLWGEQPSIQETLRKSGHLTRTTKKSYDEQSKCIDELNDESSTLTITKDLLRSVLIRNEGNHLGLVSMPPNVLREMVGILIDVIFVCWLSSMSREPAKHEVKDDG